MLTQRANWLAKDAKLGPAGPPYLKRSGAKSARFRRHRGYT
jgi:hypothetical protein